MRRRKIRREIARRLKALLSRMESLPRELRPYQVEALQAVIHWLEDPNGTARAYIEHATGLGKTELFAAIVSACVGLRALIVVPTKTLIEQTARRVVAYTGGMLGHLSSLGPIKDEGGVIIAVRGHEFCDILITTDESLKLHGRFLAEKFAPHLVIRDECHGSYSEPEQAIMDYFSDAVILGFTATPDYLGTIVKESYAPVTLDNGRVLYAPPHRIARAHYGTCLDQRTVRWGIEGGYLAPLAWGHIEFDVSLDEVGIEENGETGPDYSDAQLQALLRKHWQFMVDTIVQLYKRGEYDLPSRQVFAVCASVREAQQIAAALKDAGFPAACITGKTRDKERQSILEKFKAGEIKFLSSVMVLREGWDAPNAEVCLMLRPTRSRVLYMQSMGRVLRTMPDGSFKCALVIDAYFLNTKFAPLSAPVLFGLPGQMVEDGGILVGPKDGYVPIPSRSPYQRPGVKPKVIIIPAEYEAEVVNSLYSTLLEASLAAQKLKIQTSSEYLGHRGHAARYKEDPRLPCTPYKVYPDWVDWPTFLGTKCYETLAEASAAARKLGIRTITEYIHRARYKEDSRLSSRPQLHYPDWVDWPTFLGTKCYETLAEASAAARKLEIRTSKEYGEQARYKEDARLPSNPDSYYPDWVDWPTFLGTKCYETLAEASAAARKLEIRTSMQYRGQRGNGARYKEDARLPSNPHFRYPDWVDWPTFLGTKRKEN